MASGNAESKLKNNKQQTTNNNNNNNNNNNTNNNNNDDNEREPDSHTGRGSTLAYPHPSST